MVKYLQKKSQTQDYLQRRQVGRVWEDKHGAVVNLELQGLHPLEMYHTSHLIVEDCSVEQRTAVRMRQRDLHLLEMLFVSYQQILKILENQVEVWFC